MSAVLALAPSPTRQDIESLQAAMAKLPQVSLETQHYFADGMYCRALEQPAECTVVGKVHLKEHFLMILKGELTISLETGMTRVSAPFIHVSKPGTKRAIFAHVDSLYVNVHRTDSTDLDQIEKELVEPDETALFDARNQVITKRLERK